MFVRHAVFEALIRGSDLENDAKLLTLIRPYYDVNNPQREYSPEAYNKILDIFANYCYPNVSREEALYRVGMFGFLGYRKTIIGRVGMAALPMLSNARAVELSVRQVRSSFSGEITYVVNDDKRYRTSFRQIPCPPQTMQGAAAVFWENKGVKAQVVLDNVSSPTSYTFDYDVLTNFLS